MDIWTEECSRLVARAGPAAAEMDLDRAWAEIQPRINPSTPIRRSRRARIVIGAGVTAAVLSVSGIAAAGILSARTGKYAVDAEDLRLGGPGERLDPARDDFREVVEDEIRGIPFPSQSAKEISVDDHVLYLSRDKNPALVATGAIRGWTAVHAICSWSNEWVTAAQAGDTDAEAEAAEMLVEARHWPAITALDSVQEDGTLTMDVTDPKTGRTRVRTVPDPTQFYYLRLVSDAVSAGDVDALAHTLARNAYCIGPSLMPNFSQALPAFLRGR